MSQGLKTSGFLAAMLTLAGCASYRPEPLHPAVELQTLKERTAELLMPSTVNAAGGPLAGYHPEDGLNEAELVMAALTFNPALREKRYEISRINGFDLLGMVRFKPELQVNVDRATVGVATDSDMIYTLLIPSLRQAWRDDDAARREQSRAEMMAAEAQVVVAVRRAHVAVLVALEQVAWSRGRVDHRRQVLDQIEVNQRSSPLDRALASLAWQRALVDARHAAGGLADARRDLNRLVGFDPQVEVKFSDQSRSLVGSHMETIANEELDHQLLSGRWELKALEASYQRAEFTYSQAVMGQLPKLRLAPAVTFDRDEGTSLKFGASVRIPWPDNAAEKAEDAHINRTRARAIYVEKLHALRAEAHAANAHVARAWTDLAALENIRAATDAALAEGAARRTAGELSLSDYLPLVERCEYLTHAWLDAAGEYRLARIELDHATGRLNRTKDP